VEENPETRALLAANLESTGYQVTAAATCEDALQAVGEIRPDVILCDVTPGGADHCAFLERARQLEGGATLPAFAVLPSGLEDDWQRLRAAGFAGHFTKPVDVRAVDRAIRAWFEMSRPSDP